MSIASSNQPDAEPAFEKGFRRQIRVIIALIIRDAMSRYGHENIGFFWVMGEPLLLSTGVMALWSVTNQSHSAEIGVVPFALTGYSIITLWRHNVSRAVHGMRHSVSLTFHPHVKFLDILFARSALETVGILAAFFIAYVPLHLLGFIMPFRDPLVFFGGWFLTAWFSFGFSLIIAAVTELSEAVDRFVQPIMYLTLPLTGVFYMVDWLPQSAQAIVIWSPLVNGCEMFRSGLFPANTPTEWDAIYLACCSFGVTAIGMPLCLYAQKRVQIV